MDMLNETIISMIRSCQKGVEQEPVVILRIATILFQSQAPGLHVPEHGGNIITVIAKALLAPIS